MKVYEADYDTNTTLVHKQTTHDTSRELHGFIDVWLTRPPPLIITSNFNQRPSSNLVVALGPFLRPSASALLTTDGQLSWSEAVVHTKPKRASERSKASCSLSCYHCRRGINQIRRSISRL